MNIQVNIRALAVAVLSSALGGCAVVAVADAAATVAATTVSVAATAVKTTVNVAAAGVNAILPGDKDKK